MQISSISLSRDKFKRNVEIFFSIVLGLLTIILILYLLYSPNYSAPYREPETQDPLVIDSITTKGKSTIIEVLDPKIIEYGDKKLTLPEGWEISAKYKLAESSKLSCTGKSPEDCTVTEVSKGNTTYYFSDIKLNFPEFERLSKDGKIILAGSKSVEFEQKLYEFAVLPDNFDATKAPEMGDIDVTVTEVPVYLTGCVDTALCVATQTLPNDQESNNSAIAAFEEFLKAFNI